VRGEAACEVCCVEGLVACRGRLGDKVLESADGGLCVSTYRVGFLGAHDRCVGIHVWLIEMVRKRGEEEGEL
jgi:hypothetical protein